MKTVVSNTTPLSAFLRIDRQELLRDLYGSILIPSGVADELEHGKRWFGDWRKKLPWVESRELTSSPFLNLLNSELDRGEAEALTLAAELNASMLLLDEAAGRSMAQRLKMPTIGSVGCVLLAWRRGLVPKAMPLIYELRDHGGLWLDNRFLEDVARTIGE